MKAELQAIALVAAMTVPTASTAWAEEPTVAEEMLEILRERHDISEEHYEELLDRAREEEAARRATPPAVGAAAAEPADDTSWDAHWKNGMRFERRDGAFVFQIGGRIQTDFASISQQSSLRTFFEAMDVDPLAGTGVEFRRARIYVQGTLYENLFFKAEYDFAGGEVDFTDVYLGLRNLPWVGTLLVGHAKEPFSLEYMTSSKYTTFMERALPYVFTPGRNTGILLRNDAFDRRLTWAVGGFHDTGATGSGFSKNAAYDVTARVSGLPWYEDEGRHLVHLGLSYSHQFRNDEMGLRYRERPEAHLAQRYVDTSIYDSDVSIPAKGVDLVGAEFASVCGPFSLQGEATYSRVERTMGMEPVHFWGAYGQVSYFLTGEHRKYDRTYGSFGRTSPKESLDWQKGQWGAWELALRGSHLDLDSRDVVGGQLTDLTAALNWYPFSNARVMTNFVWAQRADIGDAYIYQMRFQIDF